jgi:DNA-directed RNA polymerase subunit RPC12/RpoP
MPDDDIPVAEVIEKPPTISRVPPSGRLFPCPMCGARLEYNPKSRGLNCTYCGYDKKIDRGTPDEVPENDYLDFLDREETNGKAVPGRSQEVHCTGCGANVLLEDKVATEKCPFCLTHLENASVEATHAMIPPESLLPFTVDLREAREAYNTWIKSLWFAPNSLKRLANLGQLTGLYIPYWTYDAMTVTFYTGERGDNYTDFVYYTDSNGQRQTRTVIRTRWRSVSGEVRHFFDDVLICGSKSLPMELLNKIAEWPLQKLEPFRAEFLSGFRTERYAVNLQSGYKMSKEVMRPYIHTLVCHDIGGDHQRVHQENTKFSAITFKPLLLPMWIAVYRYHEQTYQIVVNGRSAKVAGYRPYSGWKIASFTLMCLAIIGGLVWLFLKFRGAG